jgi:hypothetical protein
VVEPEVVVEIAVDAQVVIAEADLRWKATTNKNSELRRSAPSLR